MDRTPPIIDMRLDGSFGAPRHDNGFRSANPERGFRAAPRTAGVPFSAKLVLGSMLVTVVGGILAVAALAIWLVSMLLPAIVVAAAVCWGTLKWRRWQARGMAQPRTPGFYRS